MSHPNASLAVLEDTASSVGVSLVGQDFLRARMFGKDLRGVQAHAVSFVKADLGHANLCGADLTRADFTEATLSYAKLRGADLSGAHLVGASLRGAWLRDANLCGADMSGADLSGAHVLGAVYDGATVWPVGKKPGRWKSTKVSGSVRRVVSVQPL